MTDLWHPAPRDHGPLEGLWIPTCSNGTTIEMGFESAGACMRYMIRSGLMPKNSVINSVRLDKVNHAEFSEDDLYEDRPADGPPDDPRWEWIETTTPGREMWTKGACNHLPDSRHPVSSDLTGELLAWFCADCGTQFDADRWPVPEGMWVPIPEVINGRSMTMAKNDGQLEFKIVQPPHPVREFLASLAGLGWSLMAPVWAMAKSFHAEYGFPFIVAQVWLWGYILGWW